MGKVKILTRILLLFVIINTPTIQKAHCEITYENNANKSISLPKDPLDYTKSEPNIVSLSTTEDNSLQADTKEKNPLIDADNRQFIRFNINTMKTPVSMILLNNENSKLIDISRGGVAISNNNKLQTGDIIPIKLNYKDIEINTAIKIIYTTENKAGAEFTNLDTPTQNQLLYLSIVLEADNNMLKTKFSS